MSASAQPMNGLPAIFSIEMMLKATPRTEGDRRFIFLEASREERDLQNEMVLAKALAASADHYLKFGNIDIDHKSIPSVAKVYGIEKPELWEIGSPVDVRIDGKSTFVKAELLRGDTPLAEKANDVWESMTKLSPARKWYPSVGGTVLAKSLQLDPATGDKIGVVSNVRWTNVAVSQQPVNQHVGGIQTIPFGVLAKSLAADGTFSLAKALEASYATDATAKTGGAAFGMQSLDTGGGLPHSYFHFREMLSKAVNAGELKGSTSPEGMADYAVSHFSLSHDEAAEWVGRYLGDLKSKLSKPHRSKQ